MAYNFVADSFYIMKLCSRLFVLYCRSCPKDENSLHFEEVRGGIEPWLMARWKARVEFLLGVIGLLFLSLTVEALRGKSYQEGVGEFERIFQGKGSSLGNIFWLLQN